MSELERQTRLLDIECRTAELALMRISLDIALTMRGHEHFKEAVFEIQRNVVRRLNFLKTKKKELECSIQIPTTTSTT